MRVEFINPFVSAGLRIVKQLIGGHPESGQLAVRSALLTTQRLSIVVRVSRQLDGYVLYGLSQVTALKVATALLGTKVPMLDEMSLSALTEMGNIITGHAAALLSEAGFQCDLTPPTVVHGLNVEIMPAIPALILPLYTQGGRIDISVALRERAAVME